MTAWLPVLVVLLLVVGVAVALRPVRTAPAVTPSEAWVAAEKHARRTVVVAWATLLSVVLYLAFVIGPAIHAATLGPLVGAAPTIAGLAFLSVTVVGELTWPRPDGAVRRAPLTRRRTADITPRALAWLAIAWLIALVALLGLCAAAAGTGGRSLSYSRAAGQVSTISPFPGWYYGRVILPPTILLTVGCLAVLVLVARRAAVADTAPADDLVLRRTSARRLLAAVQLVLAWTLAGCLYLAANAVRGVEPRWADAFGPGTSGTVAVVAALTSVAIAVAAPVIAVRGSLAHERRAVVHELPRRTQVAA